MSRLSFIARASAWLFLGAASSAYAQAAPEIEIDFVMSAPVPLSPLLTLLIALAVGAIAAHLLWRRRDESRAGSWLLGALVALPVAALLAGLHPIARAQAEPPPPPPLIPISLSSSPTTTPATFGIYNAVNDTGNTITLTSVHLNNPGPYILYGPGTTCAAGVQLAPGQSCTIFSAAL